jgi:hypothetical protein
VSRKSSDDEIVAVERNYITAGKAWVPNIPPSRGRIFAINNGSEGNVEKIFLLIHALGRCYGFIDEADMALVLSGRVGIAIARRNFGLPFRGHRLGMNKYPRKLPHRHRLGFEYPLKNTFKIPFGARRATENVQAHGTVFRKSVESDMGLGEQAEARDSTGVGELMPLSFSDFVQLQFTDDLIEKDSRGFEIAQRSGRTAGCVNHPFDSGHRDPPFCRRGFPPSGQNASLPRPDANAAP